MNALDHRRLTISEHQANLTNAARTLHWVSVQLGSCYDAALYFGEARGFKLGVKIGAVIGLIVGALVGLAIGIAISFS